MSDKPRSESPFKAFQRMRERNRQESPIRQTIQEDEALVDSEDRDPSPPIRRPTLEDQPNPFNDSTPSMTEAIRDSQRKQRESSTNPFDGSSVASSDMDSGAISPRSSFKKRKMTEEAAKELEGLDVEMNVVADLPSSTGGIGFLASKGSDLEDKSEHDGELEALLMASQKPPPVDDRKINFLEDKKTIMTFGRRIALSLMKHEWYYPKSKAQEEIDPSVMTLEERKTLKNSIRAAKQEAYPFTIAQLAKPSLEDAWAYFEHITLPRYIRDVPSDADKKIGKEDEDSNADLEEANGNTEVPNKKPKKPKKSYNRAEPGERDVETRLYNPLFTPHKELGDWGLGVGLYFTTMQAMGIVTFVAGLLSIPNIIYYSSEEYSDNQDNVSVHLKGSAICTDTAWVPCGTCSFGDFADRRVGLGTSLANPEEETVFVLRNNCEGATIRTGIVNLVVLFVTIVGVAIMQWYIIRAEVKFDEDEQTAQDYSIVIRNPPEDAFDPQEWKDFFKESFEGAHATAITVGVDNDLLVRYLVQRRENLRLIEMKVDPGTPLDTLTIARLAADEERARSIFGRFLAYLLPGIPEHFAKVVVATAKIQGLAQRNHPVSSIFVTFETEAAQRRVLSALNVGKHATRKQKREAVSDPKYLFRGTVLRIVEPEEPSSIRWQDLNETTSDRLKQQAFTIFATFTAIVIIALIVRAVNDWDVRASAFAIAIFNVSFPMFAKALTSIEAHASEGNKQRSLYFKVALFRWVNTAVVISIITPFTYTLENDQGLVQQVYALFFAEIVTNSAIQLADIGGHLSRHYFAPRAKNQWSMNLNMRGAEFDLSERYTNMTKFLLLGVWYNSIFPTTLFLCSLTYFINYYVDRFSLMRTWGPAPHLGPMISAFSRKYFFSLALMAMALLSAYYWSGFPFDDVCQSVDSNEGGNNPYSGFWQIDIKGTSDVTEVTVLPNDPTFVRCNQDYFRYYDGERSFPFTARHQPSDPNLQWMTSDQETITNLWGSISLIVTAFVFLRFFASWVQNTISYYKGNDYVPRGDDQHKPFSKEESICSYIPQVRSKVFEFPLLACSVDKIDPALMDWEDSNRGYDWHDLTKDAAFLLRGKKIDQHVMFSKVAHWPPSPDIWDEEKKLAELDRLRKEEAKRGGSMVPVGPVELKAEEDQRDDEDVATTKPKDENEEESPNVKEETSDEDEEPLQTGSNDEDEATLETMEPVVDPDDSEHHEDDIRADGDDDRIKENEDDEV